MWKLFIVTIMVVISNVQTDLEHFYGEWTSVMVYPSVIVFPICVKFTLSKDPKNIECSCADGINSTLVEITLIEDDGNKTASFPVLEVQSYDEVSTTLGISCNCPDERNIQRRVLIRGIHEQYHILYEHRLTDQTYQRNTTSFYIAARNTPTYHEVRTTMRRLNDFKHRRGGVVCTEALLQEG